MKIRPIYNAKEKLNKDLAHVSRKYVSLIWLWLFTLIVLILWQGNSRAVAFDNAQQEHVTALLNEPVLEDYSTSLPDYKSPWTLPSLSELTFFTSYNPEVGQTDSSPCIGASGKNLCQMAKEGYKTIALSQDLVDRTGNKAYTYGDKVALIGSERCTGVYQVEDTMNVRYKNRGDFFCLDRSCNTSCYASLQMVAPSFLPLNFDLYGKM